MSSKTKEGIDVKVGQIWADLDKRMEGRKVYVVLVNEAHGFAFVQGWADHYGTSGRTTRIAIRRMHKHSTGWKLIKDV